MKVLHEILKFKYQVVIHVIIIMAVIISVAKAEPKFDTLAIRFGQFGITSAGIDFSSSNNTGPVQLKTKSNALENRNIDSNSIILSINIEGSSFSESWIQSDEDIILAAYFNLKKNQNIIPYGQTSIEFKKNDWEQIIDSGEKMVSGTFQNEGFQLTPDDSIIMDLELSRPIGGSNILIANRISSKLKFPYRKSTIRGLGYVYVTNSSIRVLGSLNDTDLIRIEANSITGHRLRDSFFVDNVPLDTEGMNTIIVETYDLQNNLIGYDSLEAEKNTTALQFSARLADSTEPVVTGIPVVITISSNKPLVNAWIYDESIDDSIPLVEPIESGAQTAVLGFVPGLNPQTINIFAEDSYKNSANIPFEITAVHNGNNPSELIVLYADSNQNILFEPIQFDERFFFGYSTMSEVTLSNVGFKESAFFTATLPNDIVFNNLSAELRVYSLFNTGYAWMTLYVVKDQMMIKANEIVFEKATPGDSIVYKQEKQLERDVYIQAGQQIMLEIGIRDDIHSNAMVYTTDTASLTLKRSELPLSNSNLLFTNDDLKAPLFKIINRIVLFGKEQPLSITILDLSGRVIKTIRHDEIRGCPSVLQTSNIAHGIYILEFRTKDTRYRAPLPLIQ